MTNHPNRSRLANVLRNAIKTLADNNTALTFVELTGDARQLADVQIERNHAMIITLGTLLKGG